MVATQHLIVHVSEREWASVWVSCVFREKTWGGGGGEGEVDFANWLLIYGDAYVAEFVCLFIGLKACRGNSTYACGDSLCFGRSQTNSKNRGLALMSYFILIILQLLLTLYVL